MVCGSCDAAPAERTQFCQAQNTSLATMTPSHPVPASCLHDSDLDPGMTAGG